LVFWAILLQHFHQALALTESHHLYYLFLHRRLVPGTTYSDVLTFAGCHGSNLAGVDMDAFLRQIWWRSRGSKQRSCRHKLGIRCTTTPPKTATIPSFWWGLATAVSQRRGDVRCHSGPRCLVRRSVVSTGCWHKCSCIRLSSNFAELLWEWKEVRT